MVDVVLLGPPGAGKGTQAGLLKGWLPLPHISSGDLFRAAIEAGTERGMQAKGYIDRGELVPDEITVGMVAERLAQPDCSNGVIFDGFPRTHTQAVALDQLLATMGRRTDVALYLQVRPEELLERLAGRWTCRRCGRVYHRLHHPEKTLGVCDVCGGELYQREDDRPETQARRIQVYVDQTTPLRRYYAERGVLVEIDGEQDIETVQADLRRSILSVSGNDVS